jgi:hypothetical protein
VEEVQETEEPGSEEDDGMIEQDLSQSENVVNPVPGEEESRKPNLLELAKKSPKKAGKRMVKEWNDTDQDLRNLQAQWTVNCAQKKGLMGAYVIKNKDEHTAWLPLGTHRSFTGMNKAARLCRRVNAMLFSDEAIPHVEPEGNSDTEREAAEFSARVLTILSDPSELDFPGTARESWALADTYGSGFRHFYVDERGGGHRPMQVEAGIRADGSPVQTLEESIEDPGYDPILQYVDEDGTLSVEKPENPKRVWLPKIESELLTGKNVRFIPHNVRNISTAMGAMIGTMAPWGKVKSRFPDLDDLEDDELDKIISSRPSGADKLLPVGKRTTKTETNDDTPVFVLTRYHPACAEFKFGAMLVSVGDGHVVYAEEWYDFDNDERLDIPLDQSKQHFEEDNPYGMGQMELLGPGNEIRSQLLGSLLEHLDRFNNLKKFVPITSNYQAFMAQAPTATYIPIAPGGEPKTEEMPRFPQPVENMLPFVTEDMDDESALQEAAQGVSDPAVESGKHAQQIIEQVVIGLSDLQANVKRGLERGWRIALQLIRAYYTVPQRIRWLGEDGAYKEKDWTGSDLSGSMDVRIKKGSMTMLSPSMKTNLVSSWAQMGWLNPQEGKALVAGNIQALSGLQDNVHRMRVRRQLAAWEQGPPEDWQPPEPQPDPQTGQMMQPPDPILSRIFKPLAVDLEPEVAALRAYEMGTKMATVEFANMPEKWQEGLSLAYTHMRKAAGIFTLEEQQQMQQQQAQAQQQEIQQQQQAAQQQQNTKLREAEIKSQAEIQKTAINSQNKESIPR